MKKACIFNLFHGTLYICLLQKYDTWEKLSHYFLYIFLLCNFWPSYSPCALHSVLAFSTGKWKWKSLSHVWFLVPHGLYSPWNSPGQNNGLSSRSLLQGIFPSQGLNPGLLHCRQILCHLSHQGSPHSSWGTINMGETSEMHSFSSPASSTSKSQSILATWPTWLCGPCGLHPGERLRVSVFNIPG